MIEFNCSKCGKEFKLSDESAGKKVQCSNCSKSFEIPQPEVVDDFEEVTEPSEDEIHESDDGSFDELEEVIQNMSPSIEAYLKEGLWLDWFKSLGNPNWVYKEHRKWGGAKLHRPLSFLAVNAMLWFLLALIFAGDGAFAFKTTLVSTFFFSSASICVSILLFIFQQKSIEESLANGLTSYFFGFAGLFTCTSLIFIFFNAGSIVWVPMILAIFYMLYGSIQMVLGLRVLCEWGWGMSILTVYGATILAAIVNGIVVHLLF